MPTATVTTTATTTGITTAGRIAITIETVNVWNVTIIGGSVSAAATMATIAEGRFTTVIPRVIRVGMATPAAGMATPVPCMVAPATGGTKPMASVIRMAATWHAGTYHRTSASIRILATSTETVLMATMVPSATRITTRPNTAKDMAPATKQTIVGEEAGRSSTWQLAIRNWP